MAKYETQKNFLGEEMIVRTTDDGAQEWIPPDPANRGYAEYLEWVAEGNEAKPWNPDAPASK